MDVKPAYKELEQRVKELEKENTRLRQANGQLHMNAARYQTIVESSLIGIHSYELKNDDRLVFTNANTAADRFLGLDHSIFIGQTIEDVFPSLVQTEIPFRYRQVANTGETWSTAQVQYEDETITGAFEAVVFQTAPNKIVAMFSGNNHPRRAEEKLRESEERFRVLQNASFSGIAIHEKGIIIDCNQGLSDISGYSMEELIGMNGFELFATDCHQVLMQSLLDGFEQSYDIEGIRKDGKKRHLSIHGKNITWQGRILRVTELRDITERKRLQSHILQTQKMEAVGTLAGGIAHDFNNILSAIIGCTEISLMGVSPNSKVAGYMQRVFEASQRAKGLVDQILNFSRQKEMESRPVKIRPVINEALKLLRATVPTTVSFDIDLNRDTGLIVADPTQIHQVIMNLCTNASHAMQAKGGTLSISLKNVSIDTESAKYLFNLKPGEFIHLQISDTGHGMKPAVLKQVFDPYFTTKKVGEGTGLGLAVVHGIIQNMDGDIQVYSEPGKGTTFNIFIPRTKDDTIEFENIKKEFKTGTERILLVDDEEVLTEMNGEILRSLGYQVTARVSAVEALNTFKKNPDNFDLVLTDQTMPHKTGSELAVELLKIKPNLPIILYTGFSATVDEQKAADIGIKAFLKKPVLKSRLADAVREVLSADDKNTGS